MKPVTDYYRRRAVAEALAVLRQGKLEADEVEAVRQIAKQYEEEQQKREARNGFAD